MGLQRWLCGISHFSRLLFRRRELDQELNDEIAYHIDAKTEQNVAQGMTPEEARRGARLELGGVEQVKERVRVARTGAWLDSLIQDIRFGLRMLRKSPGFTTVAILTLALGIGANTAIFSVVNAVLLEPLPFRHPSRLVQLWDTESAPGNFPLTGGDYLALQEQNRTLADTALLGWPQTANLSAGRQAETAVVDQTQANFFSVLGVQPIVGRGFANGEDQAGRNHVALLSYGFWQSHLAGDIGVLGRTARLNDETYTVIGVMPPWFNFPAGTQIWTPLDMSPGRLGGRGSHHWEAIARLKRGIAPSVAAADLTAIEIRVSKLYPNDAASVKAIAVVPLQEQLAQGSRSELWILLGAVALVLLLACANLANLLLARASGRQREMAVRTALGADRWRLARQLLTESVLLALTGTALGLALAWGTIRWLGGIESLPIPRVHPLAIDPRVLVFTAAVGLFVGILFGLGPALHASQIDLTEELKSAGQAVGSSSGLRRVRDVLAVAEIALSLTLVVGAGLFLRTFANMRHADIGVHSQGLLTVGLNLPPAHYATAAERDVFYDTLLEKIKSTPGVVSAALSSEIPLEGNASGYVTVPGNNNPELRDQVVEWNFVSPEYFRVYGVPLLQGHGFTQEDLKLAAPNAAKLLALYKASHGDLKAVPPNLVTPAIINRSMARAFWPGQNPLGKVFLGEGQQKVIGVVGDVKQSHLTEKAIPEAYFPLSVGAEIGVSYIATPRLTVRTTLDPLSLVGAVRGDVASLDSGLALVRPRTMRQVVSENMQQTSLQTFLLGLFAALAVFLAAIGIYGVMAYLVARRTREIGIRVAFGAQRVEVFRLILVHGAKLTAAGIAAGMLAAYGLTQLISSQLFGVKATDPETFIGVAAIVILVALAACYIPARRAMRVDPMVALKYE
jgi:putative ABC transport system permease protein